MTLTTTLLNNRALSTLPSIIEELTFQNKKNYLFDLSYLSSITLEGTNVADFLQGQISCDVRQVSPEYFRQGAMCNLKGRVLALLDVVCWQDLHLILPNDLLSATQSSLAKTAMLSRVKLSTGSGYQIYGFYLTNPTDLLPADVSLPLKAYDVAATDEVCCYRLENNFFIILIKDAHVTKITEPFLFNNQLHGSFGWHYLQLQQQKVQIYPETRGLFLPHRLDLHVSGYLSFDKGCYKGQEIVARTHYRAKIKHSLKIFNIVTGETPQIGKRLLALNGQEIGELIDYSPLTNNHYLIAVSILIEHPEEAIFEDYQKSILLKN